jgi:3-hydroxyisobutyrate dehydrogenase-like beta-hydroxyacid dehydrogenase
MKLVNNVLSAAAMVATSEAMVTGMKAGLDPRLMLDVINAGTGRNTATEDKFAKAVPSRHVRSRLYRRAAAEGRESFSRRARSARRADGRDRRRSPGPATHLR